MLTLPDELFTAGQQVLGSVHSRLKAPVPVPYVRSKFAADSGSNNSRALRGSVWGRILEVALEPVRMTMWGFLSK